MSIRGKGPSRKGRPPIGKKAMTEAERQRRRRKKLGKKKSLAFKKRIRVMSWNMAAAKQMPQPPGITYWRYVDVRLADGSLKEIFMPETKPLAACSCLLDDADILALSAASPPWPLKRRYSAKRRP